VAGDERLTTRISRRHFEIHRKGSDYYVIDRSKAGLLLNGKPAPRGEPAPLRSGDRLVVAGVVALEVLIREGATGGVVSPLVHVPAAAGQVVMEASMGDMVTVE
jgi:predicted component of type VI protein secretion system